MARLCWCKILNKNLILLLSQFWVNNWWKRVNNGCWDWVIKIFHTITISSSTWQLNCQILITFQKFVLRRQSSTLQSHRRVFRINFWQKSSDLKEFSFRQREFSWFCKSQLIRNNYSNLKTRFCVKSVRLRVEFFKTSNWSIPWTLRRSLPKPSMNVLKWPKSPVRKSTKPENSTDPLLKEAVLFTSLSVTWVSSILCISIL